MPHKETKKWSKNASLKEGVLDLPEGLFSLKNPTKIALTLKHAADQSQKRKSEPYNSAMSMLCFYINRAGTKLSPKQKVILENAKVELRKLYKKIY